MRKCASCGTNDAEPGMLLCSQCDLYRLLREGGYTAPVTYSFTGSTKTTGGQTLVHPTGNFIWNEARLPDDYWGYDRAELRIEYSEQEAPFTCPRHPGAAVMVIDGHETCQACFQGVI